MSIEELQANFGDLQIGKLPSAGHKVNLNDF